MWGYQILYGEKKMLVKDIMKRNIVTVSKDECLAQLIAKFRKHNFSTMPVINKKKEILGIVNHDGIMKMFLPQNPLVKKTLRPTDLNNMREYEILVPNIPQDWGLNVTASDIMNTDVITIGEDETIVDARILMMLHNIERVVVSKNHVIRGLITLNDIVIALLKRMNIIR